MEKDRVQVTVPKNISDKIDKYVDGVQIVSKPHFFLKAAVEKLEELEQIDTKIEQGDST